MQSSSSASSREAAETLGLRALAYIVADADLGPRFLDLTGLDVATLRAGASSPAVLSAVLGFLESHEPSLVATAAALAVPPSALTAANRVLAR